MTVKSMQAKLTDIYVEALSHKVSAKSDKDRRDWDAFALHIRNAFAELVSISDPK